MFQIHFIAFGILGCSYLRQQVALSIIILHPFCLCIPSPQKRLHNFLVLYGYQFSVGCLETKQRKFLVLFLSKVSQSLAVLPFLAIYRQIRDFGLLFGDGKFELAIYRQSPKFRDFGPQKLAILAKSRKSLRFRRNTDKKGHFSGYFLLNFEQDKVLRKSQFLKPQKCNIFLKEYFF